MALLNYCSFDIGKHAGKKVCRAIIFKNLQVWLVILLPLYSLAVSCVFQQNRLYLENEVVTNDDDDDNCDDKDKNDIWTVDCNDSFVGVVDEMVVPGKWGSGPYSSLQGFHLCFSTCQYQNKKFHLSSQNHKIAKTVRIDGNRGQILAESHLSKFPIKYFIKIALKEKEDFQSTHLWFSQSKLIIFVWFFIHHHHQSSSLSSWSSSSSSLWSSPSSSSPPLILGLSVVFSVRQQPRQPILAKLQADNRHCFTHFFLRYLRILRH